MKFGIFSLMTLRDNAGGVVSVMDDTKQMVQAAEQAGFDIAWFAEHHFCNYSSCPSPLMMASYAAGWTSKIKLGTGVLVLPLYNPLRLAQEIAFLDAQSQGRTVIGLGTGYQLFEFERYGIGIDDKVDMFLEYWDVIEQALTQGEVEYQGKHIQVPHTTFAIPPQQQPMSPIYYTSTQPALLERFKNANAIPFLAASTLGSPVLYKMVDGLNDNWRKVGSDPSTKPLSIMQYVHVTDSRSEALEAGERARYVGRMAHHLRHNVLPMNGRYIRDLAFEGEQTIEQYTANTVIGSAEEVAARMIQDIQRLDPVHYACNFQFGSMPLARAKHSLERFATEVVPLIERELGPLDKIGQR